jgi:hypothetical protein
MRQKETKKTPSIMRIAIDIGGVISKQTNGNPTSNTDWHMIRDSEVTRAFLSIRQLVKDFGADNVFIISKAGPTMAKLSRQWLTDTMVIDEITGFKLENIHFCSTRSGPRGKGVIARKLGITHMVDDHDEALKDVYLAQSENGAAFPLCGQLFHFASSGVGHPPSCKHWKQEERPDCVIPVGSWKEVMERLRIPTKSTQ